MSDQHERMLKRMEMAAESNDEDVRLLGLDLKLTQTNLALARIDLIDVRQEADATSEILSRERKEWREVCGRLETRAADAEARLDAVTSE